MYDLTHPIFDGDGEGCAPDIFANSSKTGQVILTKLNKYATVLMHRNLT